MSVGFHVISYRVISMRFCNFALSWNGLSCEQHFTFPISKLYHSGRDIVLINFACFWHVWSDIIQHYPNNSKNIKKKCMDNNDFKSIRSLSKFQCQQYNKNFVSWKYSTIIPSTGLYIWYIRSYVPVSPVRSHIDAQTRSKRDPPFIYIIKINVLHLHSANTHLFKSPHRMILLDGHTRDDRSPWARSRARNSVEPWVENAPVKCVKYKWSVSMNLKLFILCICFNMIVFCFLLPLSSLLDWLPQYLYEFIPYSIQHAIIMGGEVLGRTSISRQKFEK